MKNTITTILVAMAISTSVSAIEVLKGDEKPVGCEALAEIRAGNIFNRFPKDMALQSVVDDAEKMQAQKVSVQIIAHQHPKLGRDFTAVGTAWKCVK